jgi:hypothetical protein
MNQLDSGIRVRRQQSSMDINNSKEKNSTKLAQLFFHFRV